jgi:hypothetical protein
MAPHQPFPAVVLLMLAVVEVVGILGHQRQVVPADLVAAVLDLEIPALMALTALLILVAVAVAQARLLATLVMAALVAPVSSSLNTKRHLIPFLFLHLHGIGPHLPVLRLLVI